MVSWYEHRRGGHGQERTQKRGRRCSERDGEGGLVCIEGTDFRARKTKALLALETKALLALEGQTQEKFLR